MIYRNLHKLRRNTLRVTRPGNHTHLQSLPDWVEPKHAKSYIAPDDATCSANRTHSHAAGLTGAAFHIDALEYMYVLQTLVSPDWYCKDRQREASSIHVLTPSPDGIAASRDELIQGQPCLRKATSPMHMSPALHAKKSHRRGQDHNKICLFRLSPRKTTVSSLLITPVGAQMLAMWS